MIDYTIYCHRQFLNKIIYVFENFVNFRSFKNNILFNKTVVLENKNFLFDVSKKEALIICKRNNNLLTILGYASCYTYIIVLFDKQDMC